MTHKIPEFLGSRKGRDLLLVGAVVATALAGFALGRLSVSHAGELPPISLCDTAASTSLAAAGAAHMQANAPLEGTAGKVPAPSPASSSAQPNVPDTAVQGSGQYVGSKSGSAYHLPWCPGAQRIKEENKVWFASKAEAEAAGYKPAGNCKGM